MAANAMQATGAAIVANSDKVATVAGAVGLGLVSLPKEEEDAMK